MRLIEADGKMLLRRCGLPVPHGRLHGADDAVEVPAGGAAVKAQIFAGARGKHGFVQLAAEPDVRDVFAAMAERMRAEARAAHPGGRQGRRSRPSAISPGGSTTCGERR